MIKFSDVVDKLRGFKQELGKYGYEYIFYTIPGDQYPREFIYIISFGLHDDIVSHSGYSVTRNVNPDDPHEDYINMKLLETYQSAIDLLKQYGDYKKGRPTAEKFDSEERCNIRSNEKI